MTGRNPDALARSSEWMQHAACRDVDPETFFPNNNITGIEEARTVCRTCSVREECLADCLRREGARGAAYRFGVYAALTPRQRVRLYERLRSAGRKP